MLWLFQHTTAGQPFGKYVSAETWERACETFASSTTFNGGETWDARSGLSAEEFVRSRANGAILVGEGVSRAEAWQMDLDGVWLVYPKPTPLPKVVPPDLTKKPLLHEETVLPFEEV